MLWHKVHMIHHSSGRYSFLRLTDGNYPLIFGAKQDKIELVMKTTQRFVVAYSHLRFESCVVLEGNQTGTEATTAISMFESCVVLEGNQTTVWNGIRAAVV